MLGNIAMIIITRNMQRNYQVSLDTCKKVIEGNKKITKKNN